MYDNRYNYDAGISDPLAICPCKSNGCTHACTAMDAGCMRSCLSGCSLSCKGSCTGLSRNLI